MDSSSALDPNNPNFNAELFHNILLKDCSLKQLLDKEDTVVRDAQTLHSEMQTLVYENYNKFISASETINKMKINFKQMENEMHMLTDNMNSITSLSDHITTSLYNTRKQVADLCKEHNMLKKLQFLFKLPVQLKTHLSNGNIRKAVEEYKQAVQVLDTYGDLESFDGIKKDCEKIVGDLHVELHGRLNNAEKNISELKECIQLLLLLDEPINDLSREFLNNTTQRSDKILMDLEKFSECQDILEFIEHDGHRFLNDLCISVASYQDLFIYNQDNEKESRDRILLEECDKFISKNMDTFFSIIQRRIEFQSKADNSVKLVQAIDKLYRKLQSATILTPHLDYANSSAEIIIKATRRQCKLHLNALKMYFNDTLNNVKSALTSNISIDVTTKSKFYGNFFNEQLISLVSNVFEKIRGILQDLMIFLQPELSFSSKSFFREIFCVDIVREGLVISFLHHIISTIDSVTGNNVPLLLFILSKAGLQYQTSIIHSLLDLVDKWFHIDEFPKSIHLSTETELCTKMFTVAQRLMNRFVKLQGTAISQMLRKSVETRDWIHGTEPRRVRSVMKRVMEELTDMETQVGIFFEESSRTDRSSDSSRKTHSRHQRSVSNWSSNHSVNVINKLFSERVDIFAPVVFTKNSILTGIIKISLKALLECIRLKSFGKYGLQQVQVDVHYLQLHLWRFLSDENSINSLLDDILGSAVQRCLSPTLMEPSVVEIICERN